MVELSVIVVTYRGAERLGATLDSIAGHTVSVSFELIVVDNAGDDAIVAAGRERGARVVRAGTNLGFAGGANLGLREAQGRYVCLCNPDVELRDDALSALCRWLDEHARAGGAAPVLLRGDEPQPYSYGDAPSPAYLLRRLGERLRGRYLHAWDGGEPRQVDWAAGTCLVVRQAVACAVGPLDEQFFLYWEDVDWGVRFRGAGYPIWLVPAVRVVHEGGTSVGAGATGHYDRSLVRYLGKHHGGLAAAVAFWALRVYRALRR